MNKFNFKIKQKRQAPSQDEVDKQGNWIVLLPFPTDKSKRDKFPYINILINRRGQLQKKTADSDPVVTNLPNEAGSRVAYACIDPNISAFELLTLARKLVAVFKNANDSTLSVYVSAAPPSQKERLAEAIIAAAATSSAQMPSFKTGSNEDKKISVLNLYGVMKNGGFRRTLAEAEGNGLCRRLSMMPSNRLTPADYLKQVKSLARENNWKLEFLGIDWLKKKKAGAFLAVTQASPIQDAGIIRLRYMPSGRAINKSLALVGKGICFDTGGTNLKPAKYMFGMHEDMQGSAVALGTFLALTRMKVKYPVDCWLALATNHIGPKAYKPNDVVIAADGTSIEIVHTDAEGRMVLSDTLFFASQKKPDLIIDYATLTGACVYSVGTAYSGIFTNKEKYIPKLVKAGQDSGERVWPFPMDEDYLKPLQSEIADIKQCALEGNTDHILAAKFLQRFVKHDVPWIHIDLASSNNKGGLAHIPTDTTGFGIRYTLKLLIDSKII